MLKSCTFIIVILLLSSCCKPIILDENLFNNNTDNRIEVRVYSSGSFTSKFIEAKSTSEAYLNSPTATIPTDSIILLFNGKYQQTHYNYTIKKPSANAKVLQFENERNILNLNYYQVIKKELACGGGSTTHTYRF